MTTGTPPLLWLGQDFHILVPPTPFARDFDLLNVSTLLVVGEPLAGTAPLVFDTLIGTGSKDHVVRVALAPSNRRLKKGIAFANPCGLCVHLSPRVLGLYGRVPPYRNEKKLS